MPKIVDHDQRRQEIIEASWRVIARDGLEGLTMRKIARAADCTTGRLTHYFEDREELVLAALGAAFESTKARMVAIVNGPGSAQERLLNALRETLPLDEKRLLEWRVWIAFWSLAAADSELAASNDLHHAEWRDGMTPLIHEFAPNCDAQYEAERIMALVNGLGGVAAISPNPENRARSLQILERHIEDLAAR